MLLHSPTAKQGMQAPDFELPDFDGNPHTLHSLAQGKPFVVAFICNHCPYVKAIVENMVADANTLQDEGIAFIAINSNDFSYVTADSPPHMKQFAEDHNFGFKYLVDESQTVGKAYGAICTPDFFGFNAKGQLQYRGRLDDFRMGGTPTQERTHELINAMKHIKETGTGPDTQQSSMGCSIKWKPNHD